uniref:Uncharacterized protein n=1 Tax=Anguilla anguilla TaxID=7936 RepID=A0A0E9PJ27_ANGAN
MDSAVKHLSVSARIIIRDCAFKGGIITGLSSYIRRR